MPLKLEVKSMHKEPFIAEHPLIQHKIGYIRRKETGTKDFRQTGFFGEYGPKDLEILRRITNDP